MAQFAVEKQVSNLMAYSKSISPLSIYCSFVDILTDLDNPLLKYGFAMFFPEFPFGNNLEICPKLIQHLQYSQRINWCIV